LSFLQIVRQKLASIAEVVAELHKHECVIVLCIVLAVKGAGEVLDGAGVVEVPWIDFNWISTWLQEVCVKHYSGLIDYRSLIPVHVKNTPNCQSSVAFSKFFRH